MKAQLANFLGKGGEKMVEELKNSVVEKDNIIDDYKMQLAGTINFLYFYFCYHFYFLTLIFVAPPLWRTTLPGGLKSTLHFILKD